MANHKRLISSADHKVVGWVASVLIHLLLILVVIFFLKLERENDNDAYEGVLVSFGLPVESAGEEEAKSLPDIDEQQEVQEEELTEEMKEEQPVEEISTSITEEESNVQLEQLPEKKPAQKRPTIPEEKVEESEEQQLDKAKNEYGKLFSKKGTGGADGQNQGDPLGEPDAEILKGISKGRGKVGGGLDERGVLFEPEIVEQSQKSGKVVVKVCVNKEGKVISSQFTQRGSTTTDRDLVEVAEISARKYRFMPSDYEEQCGTISINFIVR